MNLTETANLIELESDWNAFLRVLLDKSTDQGIREKSAEFLDRSQERLDRHKRTIQDATKAEATESG